MDLSEILSKTKKRSEKIKNVRKPPSIASSDRPYSISDLKEEQEKILSINAENTIKTDNKAATIEGVVGNKVASLEEKPETNRQQSDNNAITRTSFSMVVGLQRACLLFVYQSCKANRSKITESLSLEHISQQLKTSSGSIKTTLQRLEKKGCLIRVEFKNGRGGWSTYEIPETIFNEMLRQETDNKLITNWQQTGNMVIGATQPSFDHGTGVSEASVTSEKKVLKAFPEEWQSINIDQLKWIGFTVTHILQLAQSNKLEPSIVQDSIDAYAFDLTHNNKAETIKGDLISYFMGIVRNGMPYTPPKNYESPQDLAMRIYLEHKKEASDKREAQETELKNLAYLEWENKLNEVEKIEMVPEPQRNMSGPGSTAIKKAYLRPFFDENIWPEERKKINI